MHDVPGRAPTLIGLALSLAGPGVIALILAHVATDLWGLL
jgi:hypothetical protein